MGGSEDGLHPEIVFLADGIELVVVAAGAGQGQTHEGRSRHVDPIGQTFVAELGGVQGGLADGGSKPVEAGADAGFQVSHLCGPNGVAGVVEVQVVGPQLVGRDLFLDEAVVRFVFVERLDHVVPVAPGVGIILVRLEPAAIGVAHHVEPMPGPALAIGGRLQQLVHELLERLGGLVPEEGLHLIRRGRQSDQVDVDSTDQLRPARFGSRFQALGMEPGQHEVVDGIANPAGRFEDLGRLGTNRCAKGPPSGAAGFRSGRVGPGRPGLDPGLEGFQVLLGKPFLSGRHLQIAHVGDGLVEQAGAGPARLHCRTAVAATQHTLPGSEIQARGADGAVAAQALVLEDLRDAIGVAGPGRRRPARRPAEDGDGEDHPKTACLHGGGGLRNVHGAIRSISFDLSSRRRLLSWTCGVGIATRFGCAAAARTGFPGPFEPLPIDSLRFGQLT